MAIFAAAAEADTFVVPAGGNYADYNIYSQFSGGLFTEAWIIGGTNSTGGDETISMTWRERYANETPGTATDPPITFASTGKGLASDVLSLTGMDYVGAGDQDHKTDVFVLKMTYDETIMLAQWPGLTESELGTMDILHLMFYNEDITRWIYAIEGNMPLPDYPADYTSFQGTWEEAGSPLTLHRYGVNIADNTVWAVLNHNTLFAVPEPATMTLLAVGAIGLIRRRRA